MKKIIICITLTMGLALQLFKTQAQTTDPSVIKNDPDWQIIASVQDNFINKFVISKTDLANFDLTNEQLVLNTVGMTKQDYLKNIELVRSAALRLSKKYNLNSGSCESCKADINSKNNSFRSVITKFQTNSDSYAKFRGESLGIGRYPLTSCCCCGFWFYACVSMCSASIEAFPLYLACCAFCYRSECCSSN